MTSNLPGYTQVMNVQSVPNICVMSTQAGMTSNLSGAFTSEALHDISEWAVAYCLDTYGE